MQNILNNFEKLPQKFLSSFFPPKNSIKLSSLKSYYVFPKFIRSFLIFHFSPVRISRTQSCTNMHAAASCSVLLFTLQIIRLLLQQSVLLPPFLPAVCCVRHCRLSDCYYRSQFYYHRFCLRVLVSNSLRNFESASASVFGASVLST